MIRWLTLSLFALPLVVLVSAGCDTKPADGKGCNKDKDSVICGDPQTRLACEGEKWHAETCLGPKGCEVSGMFVKCDTSLAKEGTACPKDDNLSCTLDKKSMMRCRGGKWTRTDSCLGPKGCDAGGFLVTCDTSVVAEGDLCEVSATKKGGSYGCSADKKTLLGCAMGKWKKVESCLGEQGCTAVGLAICDGPTASPGDFCIKEAEDDYACSTDKKSSLRCEEGGWKFARSCLGAEGCSSVGLLRKCDDTIQELGAACELEEDAACSTDGKTILQCKGGKFIKSRACPKACKVSGSTIGCE
jgi:hypothetical protein